MILYGSMMITIVVKVRSLNSSCGRFISLLIVLCCATISLFLGGCVASSTTILEEESVNNFKPMHSYKSLIINDFELKREMYTNTSEELAMTIRERSYAKIPAELSGHIERFIKSRGLFNKITRDGRADTETLLLTGKFTRIGRFKISVQVTLEDGGNRQKVASFKQTLWDVKDTTLSISDLGREVAEFLYRIQYK